MSYASAIYLIIYIITTCYLFFVAGRVFPSRRDAPDACVTHLPNWDVRYAASWLIGVWAFTFIIYLPNTILPLTGKSAFYCNAFSGLFSVLVSTVTGFWAIGRFLHLKQFVPRTAMALLALGIAAYLWYILTASDTVFAALTVVLASIVVYGCVYFSRGYKYYKRMLQAEYSDLTNRDLTWVWGVIGMMIIQGFIFLAGNFTHSLVLDYVGMFTSILGSTFIASSAYRMLPIRDNLAEDENEAQELNYNDEHAPFAAVSAADRDAPAPASAAPASAATDEEKAEASSSRDKIFDIIRQKLKSQCEETQLFLDTELTREILCEHIGVNRTYLSEYLRNEGTTYYNYINSLRINYAVQLMRAQPNISLIDVSARAGYNTPSTFRKAFREIMGCLPSEYVVPRR